MKEIRVLTFLIWGLGFWIWIVEKAKIFVGVIAFIEGMN